MFVNWENYTKFNSKLTPIMKKIYIFLLFSFLVCTPFLSFANCNINESEITFRISVSQWAYELSWNIIDGNGVIVYQDNFAPGSSTGFREASICVPENSCLVFRINDTYGDGMSCGICASDYFLLTLDGDTITYRQNYNFGYSDLYQFNCPPGSACFDALTAQTDVWQEAEFDNTWYTFTPALTGIYKVSTCDSNTCDTKVWFFENCTGNVFTENEEGSMAYNDDSENCAPQSELFTILQAGISYIIRIGDNADDCNSSINWLLTYEGPVIGCMDLNACNYDPLATSSGPCYFYGDPLCPDAPDLIIDGPYAANSMYMTTIFMNPNSQYDICQVQEGCVRGLGDRTIIRFATRIANIGSLDYFIGSPGNNPDQFDFQNCHNHTHYKGYAEYILYDQDLNVLPVGFKAGFCVMDIECSGGGSAKYNCGNMGISAGCSDIYGSGTTCNWIDVTDVDTGNYTFVIRTNWDQSPDALGRYESSYDNNWAQICIRIGLNTATGAKTFSLNADCPIYTDCAGVELGNAILDCEGTCNGTKLRGDLNQDGFQNLSDAQGYVSGILANTLTPSNCNDLNADGKITVFDAALLQDCYYGDFDPHIHGGDIVHDHCNFPYGYTNIADSVFYTILDYNLEDKYFDIGIKNPYGDVLAYEFTISGLQITTTQNLMDNSTFPIFPANALGGNKVIGISYMDSVIERSLVFQPLVRVYYFELLDSVICVNEIIETVNGSYEAMVNVVENGCVTINSASEITIHSADTVCFNDINLVLEATPYGGNFYGNGVSNNTFSPSDAGTGWHDLVYQYPGLTPFTFQIFVHETDVIEMIDSLTLNFSSGNIDLVALPSGGNFSGNAVFNNQFSPSLAGIGEHVITYYYLLENGCTASANTYINVITSTRIIDLHNALGVTIYPNPFNSSATLSFYNPNRVSYDIEIYNTVGQLVRNYVKVVNSELIIEKGILNEGVYFYKMSGEFINTGRFVIY